MSDLSMTLPPYLLPVQLLFTQSFLTLVAIASESYVFQRLLQYSPRKSVEYALTLNLLSLFVGWLVFLTVVANVPLSFAFQQDLISFVLFDSWLPSILSWSITIGFFTFFGTLLVEFLGFIYLKKLRGEEKAIEEEIGGRRRRLPSSRNRDYSGLFSRDEQEDQEPLYVLLLANAVSYSMIVGVLFLLQFDQVFPLS